MNPNKIFLFGLDNAGKSTISHYIKSGETLDDPKPTKIFDISQLVLSDIDFRIWDAPGQVKYRQLWGKAMDTVDIMMFVLDTSDKGRFMEAKRVFDKVVDDPMTRRVPLIFCFHKWDLPDAQEYYADAYRKFALELVSERTVHQFQTSTETGMNFQEIKDLLVDLIEKTRW